MLGKAREEIAPTGTFLWTDVRDLALAHVRAAERSEAAGKRFFITAGYFSNKEIANIIRDSFPELDSKLPTKDTKGGDYPEEGWPQISVALCACHKVLAHLLQGYTALTIRKQKKYLEWNLEP